MTPLERAEKIIRDEGWPVSHGHNAAIAEKIRIAIVEATNDELEKRRAAEAMVGELVQALPEATAKLVEHHEVGNIEKLARRGWGSHCGICRPSDFDRWARLIERARAC